MFFLFECVEFDVKLELEIYVDDVKCFYGLIVGELDEDVLFYFCVCGILLVMVKIFFIEVFVCELIESIEEEFI